MAALTTGVRAPSFILPLMDGRQISLEQALNKGPVVLAFFKISCPVCQYTFPYLERMFRANSDPSITVLGVSQDDLAKTKIFLREYGVTFPVALDSSDRYAVSNAYGLTTVPTIFYIAPGGEIEISCVSWSKAEIEAINRKLADYRNQKAVPLWKPGEDIRDFRAG